MNNNLLLVDGLNLIRRIYAAQPGQDGRDRLQSALDASVHSLQRALRECKPTHAVCVFDSREPSWRHVMYADYKLGRKHMPAVLQSNLGEFQAAFLALGVASLTLPALEADDIIATLARKIAVRNGNVIILSTDKIFLQLLSDRISIRNHFKKRTLDHAHVRQKFGVESAQLVDFLALTGDTTNNISGVPTIGSKTAAKLIREYGSLEKIIAAAGTMHSKIGETIAAHADRARKAQSLLRLQVDLELGTNLRSFRIEKHND